MSAAFISDLQAEDVDWMRRAVSQCASLFPYIPGKPVEQLLREKGLSSAIKMASNENPYGTSPKALDAMHKMLGEVHRYPDGNCTRLKKVLSEKHGVAPECILLGNGSNEVLELLIRTFAAAGDEVIYSQHGFIVYALAAKACGAFGVAVEEGDDLGHDLDAMAQAVSPRSKVICIANPNNPTGTLLLPDALQVFLDRLPRDVVVVVDEAYHEYVADIWGHISLRHPGLVRCRTFSKAFGLAGCRVGYAVADAELISLANRFREPFNVNQLAQHAAIAAVSDTAWVMERVAACKLERARLESELITLGVSGGTSYGNFVLLKHKQAAHIANGLEDLGLIVRPLTPYGMPDYLRISVGLKQENDQFLDGLKKVLAEQ